ncbi:MAG: hypothetical protein RDV41_06905 [Planctomycetota bacterium]|nr:hypothetical protein [Planctomycetota bacterium]
MRSKRLLKDIIWLALPFSRSRRNPLQDDGYCVYVLMPKTMYAKRSLLWGRRAAETITGFKVEKDRDCGREAWPNFLVDLKGLAKASGYGKMQVLRWVQHGLPCLHLDGKLWFLLEEVDWWLEEAEKTRKVRGRDRGRGEVPKGLAAKHRGRGGVPTDLAKKKRGK